VNFGYYFTAPLFIKVLFLFILFTFPTSVVRGFSLVQLMHDPEGSHYASCNRMLFRREGQ